MSYFTRKRLRRAKFEASDYAALFEQTDQAEFFEVSHDQVQELIQNSKSFAPDFASLMQLTKIFPPFCKAEKKRKYRILNESGHILALSCDVCRHAPKSYVLTGPSNLLVELTYSL